MTLKRCKPTFVVYTIVTDMCNCTYIVSIVWQVRLQHEVYPEVAEQASRQILLINEVEIRDRLVSSKINKFLYQYTSDTMPRQSHANMVCFLRKAKCFMHAQ